MKRYRNENGNLTMNIHDIEKITAAEGRAYYQIGNIYSRNNTEYVYIKDTGSLAFFHAFSGKKLFIPIESLGTFLPDVASEGMELTLVAD